MRVAVSGGAVSPPIDVTLEILGRETTLARLDRAIAWSSRRDRRRQLICLFAMFEKELSTPSVV